MVAVTGPMTNIALALRLEPQIGAALREIVVMGGAREEGGNITASAEYNIYADPHAAAIVFSSGLPIVAIGGSNGKTTTKELLASVLRQKFNTLWSEASFNNDIGVPLTLLKLADRLNQMPLGIVGIALGTAILPMLARHPWHSGCSTSTASLAYSSVPTSSRSPRVRPSGST